MSRLCLVQLKKGGEKPLYKRSREKMAIIPGCARDEGTKQERKIPGAGETGQTTME